MRLGPWLFSALAVTSALWAADPFVGTWKLNLAQSKHLPDDESNPWPKEASLTVEERGGELVFTDRELSNDGKVLLRVSKVSAQGGTFTVIKGSTAPAGQTQVLKRVNDRTTEIVTMQDGKALRTEHAVLSEDGKTVTTEVKGTSVNPKRAGKRIDRVEVFDKQ